MDKIINIIKKEYKTIVGFSFILYLFYWITFVLTPTMEMSVDEKQKIDSLNTLIKEMYAEQEKLDDKIDNINNEIKDVDSSIDKIKGQKIIIKEKYHEKINRASNFTEPELDSFFSDRYK
jgi:flagellar capping protein FliD